MGNSIVGTLRDVHLKISVFQFTKKITVKSISNGRNSWKSFEFETEIVVVEHPFLIPKMYQNRPERCFISKPRLERKHSSPPLLDIGNVLSHRDNLSALLTKQALNRHLNI